MTNLVSFFILLILSVNLNAQPIGLDNIDFADSLKFKQSVVRNINKQIEYVQYDEIDGHLRKISYFNLPNKAVKDKIWSDTLISEIDYTYYEKNQVIKRYDVIHKKPLTTLIKVNYKYPALAMENEIEGIIEFKLAYDSLCIPVSYIILNKLGYGIDEEVEKGIKLMLSLAKKYNVSYDQCNEIKENFKVIFRLK